MCHSQPAREKNERGRNETNHSDATDKLCGKLPRSLAANATGVLAPAGIRSSAGFASLSTAKHSRIMARPSASATVRQDTCEKRKTRPGGHRDGSSHTGAWGGWALAPNTASMGGIVAPP